MQTKTIQNNYLSTRITNINDVKINFIPDMALPNKNTGMVDGLGHTRLEDQSLKAALEEILDSKSQDIIKLVLTLIQQPIPVHPPQKCFPLKNTSWVFLIKGEKHSSIVTNTAQRILNPP